MSNKIYTVTKYSYRGEHDCFLPGIFCHTAVSEEQLLDLVHRYLEMTSLKKAWMTQNKDDLNCFYVTYTDSYEREFYHGYRITVTDLTSGKTDILTKDTYPELWDKIKNIVNETI